VGGAQPEERFMEKEASITEIVVYRLDIAKKQPFRFSLGMVEQTENILVRVYSSDGLYGTGEGAPLWPITGETQSIAFESAKVLGRLWVGENPYAIEDRIAEINRFMPYNTTAKSAMDMALYDLLAKRAGLPLYALLGGENRSFHTDETIGLDEPRAMAQEAADIVGRGFPAIKVKLGTNRADDLARIQAIREAVGDEVLLRIDANQGWDPVTAVQILQDLAPYSIQYCEEPVACWNKDALRRVRDKSPIPIMADESVFDHHDAFHLASAGACDYFNIKLAKSGGIHTALKINAVAESAGMHCMVGCMTETRLGLSAAAHLVSARPNIVFADLDSAFNQQVDVVAGGITYECGRVILTDTPGHGADVKPEVLSGLDGTVLIR
jgi:L-alanine-DL-glutamate epimerase-like enolase superfamily enzyme